MIAPTDLVTVRQAFDAMRVFLAQFNERVPAPGRETIDELLRWTAIESDGGTFDPAQWHDWTASVDRALAQPDKPPS